ncbi:hypothetical protein NIIDMKKI_66770 [Mycobacterium kansasii]|uniref:3-hydroxyacyl-CoA dehydrogenase NAD binding domain-containing protein n=1 Tax=Mycobacterium kansasii TaxID=1768 RepID=A0A7G1IKD4_MYCKA|nr:hypothetical protein NIIDMKKI_66770 [Mycobacterium kansasii]
MSDAAIQRVGVIGAGQMGSGIAEVSVRAGVEVTVFETNEALVTAGRNRIVKSLERGVSAGKVTERERDRALSNLTFTTDLNDLADRQLVIEAVVEDEAVKAAIFAELDRVVSDPDAVLASNTSSIPVMRIAAATKNPQRVLGLHFFNPVPVLPLVELVTTLVTDEAAAARTEEFAGTVLGKQVVRCSDRSGFVVNALWCRICCRRSGWSRPGSPRSKMSTRPSSPGCRIRWDRCACPTSSASTRSN